MIYRLFLSQREDTNTDFNKSTQFLFLSQKLTDRKDIPQ